MLYTKSGFENLLNVLSKYQCKVLFTSPNADAGSEKIINMINKFIENENNHMLIPSLGQNLFLNALMLFDCIIGNSSSGIIEAPLIGIPSLSIGDRQKGRKSFGKISYSNGSFDDICEKINILIDENRNSQFPRSLQIGGSSPSYEIIKRLKEIINL